jgi:diaminopimelate epimerase
MSGAGRAFYKMSGSGNDFVVFDARTEPAGALEKENVIRTMCARGTGIGADGVVFVEKAPTSDADLLMRYFNSDGSRAAMCGNAALCVTRLAAELGAGAAAGMRMQTDDGVLTARYVGGLPEVDLRPVLEVKPDAGIDQAAGEHRIGFALAGVPHLVVLCDDATVVDVAGRGRALRRHASLPGGANVNFVSRRRLGWLMRTFERGVEGETLACGTGAIATAVLLTVWGESIRPQTELETRSGRKLTVTLERSGGDWKPTLRGPGDLVFRGELPS